MLLLISNKVKDKIKIKITCDKKKHNKYTSILNINFDCTMYILKPLTSNHVHESNHLCGQLLFRNPQEGGTVKELKYPMMLLNVFSIK